MSETQIPQELPQEWIERSHCWEFVEQAEVDSDRAVAIVAGAVLDEMLRRLLSIVIVDEEIARKLLGDYAAPLRTFSARINALYAFRILSKEHYEILNTIRDIRNSFAHEVDWSFAEPTTSMRCLALHLDYVVYPPGMENDPRTRFIQIASGICGVMNGQLYNFNVRGFDPNMLERVERHRWRQSRQIRNVVKAGEDRAGFPTEEYQMGEVCSAFIDQLKDQSDRAQAIVAAAALDEMLRRILNVVIDDEEVADELVNDIPAPFITFSARIDAAFAFRIIGKNLHKLLHQLRDIRNPFAHEARWSFAEQSTTDKCRNLGVKDIQYIDGLEDHPRHRFIGHANFACGQLDVILDLWNEDGFAPQLLRHVE